MNRLYDRIVRLEELLDMERGKVLELEDALYTVKERENDKIDQLEKKESIIAE